MFVYKVCEEGSNVVCSERKRERILEYGRKVHFPPLVRFIFVPSCSRAYVREEGVQRGSIRGEGPLPGGCELRR